MGGIPSQAIDAEDVALSAFHTLYQAARRNRLPDMTNRDSLWQSLLIITAGKIVDARRRESCQKRGGNGHRSISAESNNASPMALLESTLSDEADPVIMAMVEEDFDLLLRKLQDSELENIAILKLEGYTNSEIASRLECSERTVKRRLMIIRRIWHEAGVAP
jgi:DNA-directed RNA polymerase specialized sigma24 family protein